MAHTKWTASVMHKVLAAQRYKGEQICTPKLFKTNSWLNFYILHVITSAVSFVLPVCNEEQH